MKYAKTVEAIFVDRPNRFVANVMLDGQRITVHVKNTGRCKELLLPKARVILSYSDNPQRKYCYDLISVWKPNIGWVNIDSQVPNLVVKEWLLNDNKLFEGLTLIKPECKFGDSRFDFYFEQGEKKSFLEVKGCTLEIDGKGYFPDAPTERGVKHLKELIKAKMAGYDTYVAFVIAMEKVEVVYPNVQMHPEFGEAMDEAKKAGVKVLFLCCDVESDGLSIVKFKVAD